MSTKKRKTKNENSLGGPVFGEITQEKYLTFLNTSMFLDKLRFEIKRYLKHNYPTLFSSKTDHEDETELSILFGSKRFFFTYRYNVNSLFMLDVTDEDVLAGRLVDIISKKLGRQPEHDDDNISFLMEDFPSNVDMDNWVEVSQEMFEFISDIVENVKVSKRYQNYGFNEYTMLDWYRAVITTTNRSLFVSLVVEDSDITGTFGFGLDSIQQYEFDAYKLFEDGKYTFHPDKSRFSIEAEIDIFSADEVVDDVMSNGENFEFPSEEEMIEMDPDTLTPKEREVKVEETNPLDVDVKEIMDLINKLIEENFKLKEEVHRLRNGVLDGVLNKIKKPLVDYFS